MSRLLDLPTELKRMIIENITRTSDLKALCLVSRSISDIATPSLYQNLDLPYDVNDRKWRKYRSLLDNRNKNVRYVRTLRIGHSDIWQQKFKNYRPCGFLGNLLLRLGTDSLHACESGGHGQLGMEQTVALWKSQKRLTNIQLDIGESGNSISCVDLFSEESGALSALGALTAVKRVSLRIDAWTDLVMCGELLASLSSTEIQEVSLELEWTTGYELDEFETRTLEYNLVPKYLPPSLRVIRLVGVAMPRSSIIQLDSWPFLTDLSLLSCTNMGSMLHEFRSPKLVSFTLRDAPESDEILLDVLACMLRRFDTFQTLSIDSEPGGVAEAEEFRAFAEALVHHSEHLKSLILNVGLGSVPMEWGVHEYVFGEIARCAKLEELAVGMESNDLVHITKSIFTSLRHLRLFNVLLPFWGQQNLDTRHPNLALEIFQCASPNPRHSPIIMFGRTWYFLKRDKQPFPTRVSYMSAKHPAAGLTADERDWMGVVRVADEALGYLVPDSNVLRYRTLDLFDDTSEDA